MCPWPWSGQREEISVAEPLADAHRLLGDGRGGREVSLRLVPEHGGQEQVPAFRALALVLDESLRAAEPAARGADLTA